MRRSGTRNPIFLLDEVDKLARDFHGDPGAALLEVLDPEQNRTFTDHYLELEFDLSDVLFIATANTLAGIPEPLRDRMEIIRIPGYLTTEKKVIAQQFIWPKQARRHGLKEGAAAISDGALELIIREYTREAGVRELERQISGVTRKLATRGRGGVRPSERSLHRGGRSELKELLGPPPYTPEPREEGMGRAGIANGLAWTAAGGEILDVEVAVIPGSGKIQLTGTLGEVMKESAFAAVTYARSRARLLGLSPNFHEEVDIHIHIPEGATPKDGPSAGITIAVALISALTEIPTRSDVAMTGEITLRGRVLGVGGVKEKAVAAFQGNIKRILLPSTNAGDLERMPEEVLQGSRVLPGSDHGRGSGRRPCSLFPSAGPTRHQGAPGQRPGAGNPALPVIIRSVEFAGSVASPKNPLPGDLPQVAFSGRSNVGKSSLINVLLGRTRKKVAHVSSTPGKTQMLNFYRVNDRFFLVDLPGFGYAKAPGPVRESWKRLVEWYLSRPDGVCGVVHLVDGRHRPFQAGPGDDGVPGRRGRAHPGGPDQDGQGPQGEEREDREPRSQGARHRPGTTAGFFI